MKTLKDGPELEEVPKIGAGHLAISSILKINFLFFPLKVFFNKKITSMKKLSN